MTRNQYQRIATLLAHKYPNAYDMGVYTDYETGEEIWLADWNPVSNTVINAIDRLGIEIAFYDEYITDGNGNAYRTTPTHYGWTPSYFIWNSEVYPKHECVDDLEWYVDCLLDEEQGDVFGLDFSSQGFTKIEPEYESGWYGQDDKPDEIRAKLEAQGLEVIFSLTNSEQFRQNFVAWTRKRVTE